jgi:catechol 2,3-dioxygenase-like lactoylglutathione lyase family enzyme
MQVMNKLMMFSLAVSDMPKAKAFYVDKLGLKVVTDYRLNSTSTNGQEPTFLHAIHARVWARNATPPYFVF